MVLGHNVGHAGNGVEVWRESPVLGDDLAGRLDVLALALLLVKDALACGAAKPGLP